ncbi:hypothetical protein CUT44_21150 [Streptomyces carminius]|uniref:Uncharacterized protein n=1 Tax=Streptomyces carminius TaxID=2665496 RepID=A0A2M8LUZ8_9ACTN|nr:hypothetical protein [Streptomyces carminius]PJE95774.1 hypothetical protein CUT44_21150 [Streptomyces carminius]
MAEASVYPGEEQRRDLGQVVALAGRSQAGLVRDGISRVIRDHLIERPPVKARFGSPAMAGRSDESTDGSGA